MNFGQNIKVRCSKPSNYYCGAKYTIIGNIFNLIIWWNITLQKEIIIKCCQNSHYVKGLKSKKPTEKAIYIYCQIFINYFLIIKMYFEN